MSMEGHTIWSKNGVARGICDKYGQQLVALQLAGDGWNTAHDSFKHALCQVLRDLRVEFDCEVFGLFSALIPQGPRRARLDDGSKRAAQKRQGMVPDFRIVAGSVAQRLGIHAASSFLAELKFIHLGRARYPNRVVGVGRHREAVRLRAAKIGPEMLAHARRLDEEFGGHPVGQDGPVLQRLRSFGPVLPMVVGHFGEWNDELSHFVVAIGDDAAPRMADLFGASSQRAAKASILFFARRCLVWAGWLANARLKLGRSAYVGPTWASAAARRAEAARMDDQSDARCRDSAAHWTGLGVSQGPGAPRQAGVAG